MNDNFFEPVELIAPMMSREDQALTATVDCDKGYVCGKGSQKL